MPNPISNSGAPAPCVVETEHGPVACQTPPDAPEWGQVDVPLGELATRCLPELDAIVLGLASRNPIIGALAGIKAGFELAERIDQVQREKNLEHFVQQSNETCREHGGEPVGLRGDRFICFVPGESR